MASPLMSYVATGAGAPTGLRRSRNYPRSTGRSGSLIHSLQLPG